LNKISVSELAARSNSAFLRIDVRSGSEYATGHIHGAINIPLEEIEMRTADLNSGQPIVLICKMGQRARMAGALLEPCGYELYVLEGGTQAWRRAGLPLVSTVKSRWSLERQVRLAAGSLVLLGSVLALIASPYWLFLSGFVGLGLTFAGISDICPMGILLAWLPWNRAGHCHAGISRAVQPSAP